MIALNNSDDSWHPPSVNEVTHDISLDHIRHSLSKDFTQLFPNIIAKSMATHNHIPETSVLMPSNLQVNRQGPLSNALKYQAKQKMHSMNLLQKYDVIISQKW